MAIERSTFDPTKSGSRVDQQCASALRGRKYAWTDDIVVRKNAPGIVCRFAAGCSRWGPIEGEAFSWITVRRCSFTAAASTFWRGYLYRLSIPGEPLQTVRDPKPARAIARHYGGSIEILRFRPVRQKERGIQGGPLGNRQSSDQSSSARGHGQFVVQCERVQPRTLTDKREIRILSIGDPGTGGGSIRSPL